MHTARQRFALTSTFVALASTMILALSSTTVHAGTTAAPKDLPPGMTPATYKMMMTPGVAHPAGLPPDVVPLMGCIPTMGYHYANPKNLPFGPIYGWYNGKPTFTEIMVDQKDFAKGMSWSSQLQPLPGYKIDHVDIWFEPHGHPGYLIPHYDIHAWYIPASQYMYFCHNTSGKKPAWL
jgi:hypothetical protein